MTLVTTDHLHLVLFDVVVIFSPIAMHYFPTLYHDIHEIEDGHTASGGAVRYGFDIRQFPGYSWRGYAIYSKIQVFNQLRCWKR